ncbi:hypothetical protein AB6F55_10030 [Providencia hangzhouensis]
MVRNNGDLSGYRWEEIETSTIVKRTQRK